MGLGQSSVGQHFRGFSFNPKRFLYGEKALLLIPVTEEKIKVFALTLISANDPSMSGGLSQYCYLELFFYLLELFSKK